MVVKEYGQPGVSPPVSHANLPGVRLAYRDSGGTGIPIVLLHANTGTSASWQPQFESFVAAGYRTIAFDRRGWGQSVPDPRADRSPAASPKTSRRWQIIWRCRDFTCWASREAVLLRWITRVGDRIRCAA